MLEVVEVAPGVHAVWAHSEPRKANTYILGGDLLVEPVVQCFQDIVDWQNLVTTWPKRFKGVLLTHLHPDHARGVELMAMQLRVPLFGPPQWPKDVSGWEVLHTPGHAPEHICFWKDSTLVAGDMLYDHEPSVIPEKGGDIEAYRQSVSLLRSLKPKLVLPSHGRPVFDPDEVLAKAEELTVESNAARAELHFPGMGTRA